MIVGQNFESIKKNKIIRLADNFLRLFNWIIVIDVDLETELAVNWRLRNNKDKAHL